MERRHLGEVLACGLLGAFVLVCFSRLVAHPGSLIVDEQRPSIDYAQRFEPRPIGNDLTFLFLPRFLNDTRCLDQWGRIPQWDDNGFAGRPRIGNPQAGLFYPPLWVARWSRAAAALGWSTAAHLFLGGIGTFVLGRALRISIAGAVTAAVCFEGSPYLLAQTFEGHYPHVWAACWYPWAFLAFLGVRQGRATGIVAMPAILAMVLLAGHAQEWIYLVVTLSLWAAADVVQRLRAGHRLAALGPFAVWGGIVAFCLALAAAELVPDMAARRWTAAPGAVAAGGSSRYQLHAIHLVQLLSPEALGGPSAYLGPDNYWETVLAVGLVPLVLIGCAVARAQDRRRTIGPLVLTVSAVLFAGGRKLGLWSALGLAIPPLAQFRVPSRSLFLAALGAALLGGFGVRVLESLDSNADARRSLRRRLWRIGGLVGIGLVIALAIVRSVPGEELRSVRPQAETSLGTMAFRVHPANAYRVLLTAANTLSSGGFWIGTVGCLFILVFAGRRRTYTSGLVWGLVLLATAELGWYGRSVLRVASPERFLGPDPVSQALADASRRLPGPFRVRARDHFYGDLQAAVHGVEKINVYDSFQIGHAAVLCQTLYPLLYETVDPDRGDPMGDVAARHWSEVRQGVLDRLNVRFLVSKGVQPACRWPLVSWGTWRGETFAVYRNETALPRAYVVPRAEVAAEQAGGILSQFARVDARRAVLMRADPLRSDGPRQPFTPALWVSDDPDRIRLKVTTQSPGLLVIADTWMPGWSAVVDGRPTEILKGNLAQRVVALPRAGRHEIRLTYQTPGLALGSAVSQSAVLVWGILGGAVLFRRRLIRRLQMRIRAPGPIGQGAGELSSRQFSALEETDVSVT